MLPVISILATGLTVQANDEAQKNDHNIIKSCFFIVQILLSIDILLNKDRINTLILNDK